MLPTSYARSAAADSASNSAANRRPTLVQSYRACAVRLSTSLYRTPKRNAVDTLAAMSATVSMGLSFIAATAAAGDDARRGFQREQLGGPLDALFGEEWERAVGVNPAAKHDERSRRGKVAYALALRDVPN